MTNYRDEGLIVEHVTTKGKTTLQIETFTTADVFDTLRGDWNTLLGRSRINTIFNTIQWHENWWMAYAPGELWVHVIRDADKVVGIAPFFIEVASDDKKVVRCIGSEDVTDYLDLIVDADYEDRVYVALADYFVENADQYDVIDLVNIVENSPTKTLLVENLQNHQFEVDVTEHEVCPVIALPDTWDAYLEGLDKKQRHEVRRKLRHAEGQKRMGGLDWYIVTDEHDLDKEIDQFIELMAASHPEKREFLQNDAHVRFFKIMVPAMMDAGWLQLNFLVINDTDYVATYLNFDYNNQILVYNSGLDPNAYSRLSPGIILLSYNIQHAIDAGRERFDFLRGDETYKYRMGGENTRLYRVRAMTKS